VLNGTPNEIALISDTIHNLSKDCFALGPPFCKICNVMPFCVNTFVVRMYYIVHKQVDLIQVVIHLRTHDHFIVEGKCRNVMEQVKFLVQDKVFHNLSITLSIIFLVTIFFFLFKHSFNEDGDELVEPLNEDKLCQMMDKFTTLCYPNIRNFVVSYKQHLCNRAYVSSILFLKANNGYDYI